MPINQNVEQGNNNSCSNSYSIATVNEKTIWSTIFNTGLSDTDQLISISDVDKNKKIDPHKHDLRYKNKKSSIYRGKRSGLFYNQSFDTAESDIISDIFFSQFQNNQYLVKLKLNYVKSILLIETNYNSTLLNITKYFDNFNIESKELKLIINSFIFSIYDNKSISFNILNILEIDNFNNSIDCLCPQRDSEVENLVFSNTFGSNLHKFIKSLAEIEQLCYRIKDFILIKSEVMNVCIIKSSSLMSKGGKWADIIFKLNQKINNLNNEIKKANELLNSIEITYYKSIKITESYIQQYFEPNVDDSFILSCNGILQSIQNNSVKIEDTENEEYHLFAEIYTTVQAFQLLSDKKKKEKIIQGFIKLIILHSINTFNKHNKEKAPLIRDLLIFKNAFQEYTDNNISELISVNFTPSKLKFKYDVKDKNTTYSVHCVNMEEIINRILDNSRKLITDNQVRKIEREHRLTYTHITELLSAYNNISQLLQGTDFKNKKVLIEKELCEIKFDYLFGHQVQYLNSKIELLTSKLKDNTLEFEKQSKSGSLLNFSNLYSSEINTKAKQIKSKLEEKINKNKIKIKQLLDYKDVENIHNSHIYQSHIIKYVNRNNIIINNYKIKETDTLLKLEPEDGNVTFKYNLNTLQVYKNMLTKYCNNVIGLSLENFEKCICSDHLQHIKKQIVMQENQILVLLSDEIQCLNEQIIKKSLFKVINNKDISLIIYTKKEFNKLLLSVYNNLSVVQLQLNTFINNISEISTKILEQNYEFFNKSLSLDSDTQNNIMSLNRLQLAASMLMHELNNLLSDTNTCLSNISTNGYNKENVTTTQTILEYSHFIHYNIKELDNKIHKSLNTKICEMLDKLNINKSIFDSTTLLELNQLLITFCKDVDTNFKTTNKKLIEKILEKTDSFAHHINENISSVPEVNIQNELLLHTSGSQILHTLQVSQEWEINKIITENGFQFSDKVENIIEQYIKVNRILLLCAKYDNLATIYTFLNYKNNPLNKFQILEIISKLHYK